MIILKLIKIKIFNFCINLKHFSYNWALYIWTINQFELSLLANEYEYEYE